MFFFSPSKFSFGVTILFFFCGVAVNVYSREKFSLASSADSYIFMLRGAYRVFRRNFGFNRYKIYSFSLLIVWYKLLFSKMSIIADFSLHSSINRFSSFKKSISVELNVSISSNDTCTFSSIPFSLLLTTLGTSSSLTTSWRSLPKSLTLTM